MLIPTLVLILCSNQILSAPFFFTGNSNLDGAIVGAGLGFFAGDIIIIRQFLRQELNLFSGGLLNNFGNNRRGRGGFNPRFNNCRSIFRPCVYGK